MNIEVDFVKDKDEKIHQMYFLFGGCIQSYNHFHNILDQTGYAYIVEWQCLKVVHDSDLKEVLKRDKSNDINNINM